MATVITDACILSLKCLDGVCPYDAIKAGSTMAYIDPAKCEDCYDCLDVCPVEAILKAEDLPANKQQFIQINADFFAS